MCQNNSNYEILKEKVKESISSFPKSLELTEKSLELLAQKLIKENQMQDQVYLEKEIDKTIMEQKNTSTNTKEYIELEVSTPITISNQEDLNDAIRKHSIWINYILDSSDKEYKEYKRANLAGSNLSNLNLANANLSCANLDNVNFTGANLSNTNLSRSSLLKGNFQKAILHKTNFKNAKMEHADLRDAEVIKCNFIGINFKNILLSEKLESYIK